MIRESVVDTAFNNLSAGLGSALIVRPPASTDDLVDLEQLTGPLPREFVFYLLTCNGCRINVDKPSREWTLWSTHDMLEALHAPHAAFAPRCLIPIRGEDPGYRDWLITGHDAVAGVVVRWDPWSFGAELIASCFGAYLNAWAEYILRNVRVEGVVAHVDPTAAPFDVDSVIEFDPGRDALLHDESVQLCLSELGAVAATGDDIE